MMKVAEALRTASDRLGAISDTARLDAELLMAHCLGVSRSDLLLRHMGETVPDGFTGLMERRARHEPIAYIIGEQEFFGRTFCVTPDVLIPRSDSEILIEAALEMKRDAMRVLDLGVGSGALLLTFVAETKAAGVGIDSSPEALGIAAQNMRMFQVEDRILLENRNWNKPDWTVGLGQFDLILGNPPYVEKSASLDPDVRDFEPPSALFAGPDGLDDYRVLIPQLRGLMCENAMVLLEIGSKQAELVSELAQAHGFSAELRKDLANRPRVLMLR